jgi:predicted Fe-Mo cluster-binding NifX family protein
MLNDARMRLCVPLLSADADNPGDKDLRLAAHFGLAERFAVVDSLSGEILSECGISGYCPGPCHCPLPNLVDSGVDALAGASMGFRLMQLSRRAKLPVLAVKATTLVELSREMRGKSPALALSAGKCLTTTPSRVAGARKLACPSSSIASPRNDS